MKFKNLFGGKTTPEVNPAAQSMAERVSTMAGCEALEQELVKRLETMSSGTSEFRLLRKQIDELKRLKSGLSIAADRVRVAGVVKRDREDAAKALKAAEARLHSLTDAATLADDARAERAAIVSDLSQELAALHAQADQAVAVAERSLRELIASSKHDADAEAAAFDALRKAQLSRASCGEAVAFRLKGHEAEMARLEQAAAEASEQVQTAQDEVNLRRLQLARVEYDQATQGFIDAYLSMRAMPSADSSGTLFPLSTIQTPKVTFASKERVVLGERLCGESAGLRDWVLADMPRAMAPANLALLTEEPAEVRPDPEAPLPDPNSFLAGSMAYENAKVALEIRRIGREQYEANQRAGSRADAPA